MHVPSGGFSNCLMMGSHAIPVSRNIKPMKRCYGLTVCATATYLPQCAKNSATEDNDDKECDWFTACTKTMDSRFQS